jgi:hypothetical protein
MPLLTRPSASAHMAIVRAGPNPARPRRTGRARDPAGALKRQCLMSNRATLGQISCTLRVR